MKKTLLLLFALLLTLSCARIESIENDIDALKGRVDTIEESLSKLQQAYSDGKIIKDVVPYADNDSTGWTITFSDNQTINIYDGEKGDKGEKGATAEQGERADDPLVTISIAISGLSILLNAILIICILSKKIKNT